LVTKVGGGRKGGPSQLGWCVNLLCVIIMHDCWLAALIICHAVGVLLVNYGVELLKGRVGKCDRPDSVAHTE
jgi:hypothetical protein